MKYLEFDQHGMVACYDVVPVEAQDKVVEVTDLEAAEVLKNPKGWRREGNGIVEVYSPTPDRPKRLDYNTFESGVMVDGTCYACNSFALALLTLTGRALVHERTKDTIVRVDKELQKKIVAALLTKVESAL